jgi:L-threonylcarbamoyladenylate synthase
LTIIGAAVAALPEEITSGTGTVGVRLPADENVRELVRQCGGVLTGTSANPSGREPARSAQEVAEYFPRGLDLIVDGGEVSATEPSTVLDVSSAPPRVVRAGAISQNVIDQLFAEYD